MMSSRSSHDFVQTVHFQASVSCYTKSARHLHAGAYGSLFALSTRKTNLSSARAGGIVCLSSMLARGLVPSFEMWRK